MSSAMIMRSDMRIRRVGAGDLAGDVANAVLTPVTQQVNAKVDAVRGEVLAEVAKQGREAKIYAVAGGFVAGVVGAFIVSRVARAR